MKVCPKCGQSFADGFTYCPKDTARLAKYDLRARIRHACQGSLHLEKALGANPRTILLGICMIAATPLWYFLVEGVLLNGLLLISVVYDNTVERRLLAELSRR